MKVAGIREVRARCAAILGGGEPVIVTRHGRISGLYLPLAEPDRIPDDLRHDLARVLGEHLSKLLAARGVKGETIREDFRAYRRGRR